MSGRGALIHTASVSLTVTSWSAVRINSGGPALTDSQGHSWSAGTVGVPYSTSAAISGTSTNPARSFGPDLALGDLSTWWVYLVGPVAGAVAAVGVAYVLRGPARAEEATAAMGTPLDRVT